MKKKDKSRIKYKSYFIILTTIKILIIKKIYIRRTVKRWHGNPRFVFFFSFGRREYTAWSARAKADSMALFDYVDALPISHLAESVCANGQYRIHPASVLFYRISLKHGLESGKLAYFGFNMFPIHTTSYS
jgi:hypothetical protein